MNERLSYKLILRCELSEPLFDLRLPENVQHLRVASIDDAERALIARNGDFEAVLLFADDDNPSSIRFLESLREKYPNVVRLFIAKSLRPNEFSRAYQTAHGVFLNKVSQHDLSKDLDRAFRLQQLLNHPQFVKYASSLGELPHIPSIVADLDQVLHSDRVVLKDVSAVIQQEPELLDKMLMLVNSSFFGMTTQPVNNLKELVSLIGFWPIRNLLVAAKLYEVMEQKSDWHGFGFEQLKQRSVLVSQLASELCYTSNMDQTLQSQSRLAGVFLDIGMIVLATFDAEKYHQVMIRAQELNQPLYVVEKMLLGATHAQIGAFLLDRWGVAPELVHAVLFHHTPNASGDVDFSVLTASHLADSLLPPLFNAMGINMGGRLSRDYLNSLGVINRLPSWEMTAHDMARLLRN